MIYLIQSCNVLFIILLLIFAFVNISESNSFKSVQNSNLNQIQGSYFNIYRTKDGKKSFVFRYVHMRYGYEIDIISQPDYGFRDSDPNIIHRLHSNRSDCRYMICVKTAYTPQTLEGAMRLSMDWAELTWYYIKTGVTIDRQLDRR